MKKNNAITLIALIITIIVLLILVGVTLNMVMGENGIINKAQLAKEKTNEAQKDEEEKLGIMENKMNDTLIRTTGSLPSKVITPSGTEDEPLTIGVNQRIEFDNPYPGHRLYVVVEVQYNNVWGDPGFATFSNCGYGTKATQITGDNIDKIVVQSGNKAVLTQEYLSGNGFGINTPDLHSAPYRIIAICLD